MLLAQLDGAVEQRSPVSRSPRHGGASQQAPEGRKRHLVLERDLDVELDELSRVGPRAVDDAKARPGEAEAPALALTDAETDGVAPRGRRMLSPERDEQRRTGCARNLEHALECYRASRRPARRDSRARSRGVPPAGRRWRAAPAPGPAARAAACARREDAGAPAHVPPRRAAHEMHRGRSARRPRATRASLTCRRSSPGWNEECGDELDPARRRRAVRQPGRTLVHGVLTCRSRARLQRRGPQGPAIEQAGLHQQPRGRGLSRSDRVCDGPLPSPLLLAAMCFECCQPVEPVEHVLMEERLEPSHRGARSAPPRLLQGSECATVRCDRRDASRRVAASRRGPDKARHAGESRRRPRAQARTRETSREAHASGLRASTRRYARRSRARGRGRNVRRALCGPRVVPPPARHVRRDRSEPRQRTMESRPSLRCRRRPVRCRS